MIGRPSAHPPPQSQTLISPEEDALKSNTDCVYFLASPLTCKKGGECEYRHSDVARLNPRDCYYWLNGSCLNPKCAFRHPPLEGVLGPQVATPSGPSLPPSKTAMPVSSAPFNSGKQAVPCIFFQKGFCLKGDRCPFSHGPVFGNDSKAPQGPIAAAAFPEPSPIKKPFVGMAKCSTEPKVVEAYIPPKTTKVALQAKPPFKTAPAKDESTIERHARHSSGLDDYAPNYRLTTPFANGDLFSRTNRVQQVHIPEDYDTLNSKDDDEISREPSPGFDVLVDDQLRESDYYQEEDHYEETRGSEGRRLTPVDDYDISRPVDYKDYNSIVDAVRDTYSDPRRYDSYDQTRGQYGRDQRRISSDRISGDAESKRYPRGDLIDGSDLRYRLSKHRKVNGLRSVISHDLDRDGGDQSYRGSFQRDTHHLLTSEIVVSGRLRGRIKLPGRSTSPLHERVLHSERERGISRGRLSPGRLQGFGHQGVRVHDRIKGRVHEDADDGGRSFRGSRTREIQYDNNVDFEAPKSLSELRGRKGNECDKQPMDDYQQTLSLGKRKYSESYQQAANGASFEGPKPLSEILKRKRGGRSNEEGSKDGSNAGKEPVEDSNPIDGQTLERNTGNIEMEKGLVVDNEVEHEEAYAEGEGEYEYEQVEGEYYNEEGAENTEEVEYAEDDDGDDFAKKIGAMFS